MHTDQGRPSRGVFSELYSHFLNSFVDSELVADRTALMTMVIATIPVVVQWMLLLVQPLGKKYRMLAQLPTPDLFRAAALADELWLLTLTMSVSGLVAVWNMEKLFLSPRDYIILGCLPVGRWRIFAAKLASLLTLALAVTLAVNALPSLLLPALTSGRWSLHASFLAGLWEYSKSAAAASLFALFSVAALQGALLSILRPRTFLAAANAMQGALVAALIVSAVLSFAVTPDVLASVSQPSVAPWLPPVWFLSRSPANLALPACLAVLAMTLGSYLLSYFRHERLLDTAGSRSAPTGLADTLLRWLVRSPFQQAIVSFVFQVLARSALHRAILFAYAGLGAAMLFAATGALRVRSLNKQSVLDLLVLYHLLMALLSFVAIRHSFSLPFHIRANWIFQITEAEGRHHWLDAVRGLVFAAYCVFSLLLAAPLELTWFGWSGAGDLLLFTILGLVSFELAFSSWDRIPFACTYSPGRIPPGLILAFAGLLGALSVAHAVIVRLVSNPLPLVVALSLLLFVWVHLRSRHQEAITYLRLRFEHDAGDGPRSLGLVSS